MDVMPRPRKSAPAGETGALVVGGTGVWGCVDQAPAGGTAGTGMGMPAGPPPGPPQPRSGVRGPWKVGAKLLAMATMFVPSLDCSTRTRSPLRSALRLEEAKLRKTVAPEGMVSVTVL